MGYQELTSARSLDEEMEEFIGDWLPSDTNTEIKVRIESKAVESMTIAKNIVLFIKWLGYDITFEVGEALFVPTWSAEMNKIQLIHHANNCEIYIKDIH
jgi:DNA integrity scanning protein DisA with diadenylate cyclase activity